MAFNQEEQKAKPLQAAPGSNFRSFSYETDDAEDNTAENQHGAKAFFGRNFLSAMQASRNSEQDGDKDDKKKEAREMSEEMREAAWDSAMTNLGGSNMTNAQALNTLRKINNDPDAFLDREIKAGRLKEQDREKTKQNLAKLEEYYQMQRDNKKFTGEQENDFKKLQQSDAGKLVAAEEKKQDLRLESQENETTNKFDFDKETKNEKTGTSLIDDKRLFQSAADLTSKFKEANTSTEPLDQKEQKIGPTITVAAVDVKSSAGLDF